MTTIISQSFWRDEAFSALISSKSISEIISLSMRDTNPPLFYIVSHFWIILFGNTEISLRSLTLIFHLLTVFGIYLISKNFFNSTKSQVAITLAVLLNPFLMQYAFEVRSYSLLICLTVFALFFTINKKYIYAGILLALAILTHNFGIFVFIVFSTWLLIFKRNSVRLSSIIMMLSFPFFSVILWGTTLFTQMGKVSQGFWIQRPTLSSFINSFNIFSSGDLTYPAKSILVIFTVILCILGVLNWIINRKHGQKNNLNLILIELLIVIPLLTAFFISLLFTPIYLERYLIEIVPMLILFIGYSLQGYYRLKSNIIHLLSVCIVVYFFILCLASIQVFITPTKPAIRSSVNEIAVNAGENDIIVPESNLNFLETKYYVEKSGKNIRVYAYAQDGKIPFYIGSVLFEPQEIITEIPANKRVWQIKEDGSYVLLNEIKN